MRVQPTLQLAAHAEIFALGDILAWPEQKALAKVPGHAAVVAANVLSLAAGRPPAKKYAGTFEGIFITNGKVRPSCV